MHQPSQAEMDRDLQGDLDQIEKRYGRLDFRMDSDCDSMGAQIAAIRRTLYAEAELVRLQAIIDGMAERIAGQAELISKRAEKS